LVPDPGEVGRRDQAVVAAADHDGPVCVRHRKPTSVVPDQPNLLSEREVHQLSL
jgi:hypothetical protein